MKLKQLTLKNVAGVPNRTFSFADQRAGTGRDVTVITGGPHSGKTSLLRAIAAAKEAVGAYGTAPHPMKLVRSGMDACIDATWTLSPAEQRSAEEKGEVTTTWEISTGELPEVSAALRDLFAGFSLRPDCGKVELFSARRALDTSPETPLLPKLPDQQEGRARLRESAQKYSGLLRALHDRAMEQAAGTAAMIDERGVAFRDELPDGLGAYQAAVAKMCPSVRLVAVEPRERVRPLIWFQTRERARVELADLSDSELQGFLFAAAFSWLGLSHSIVLIDLPEQSLHPADHVRFFRALCELDTNNQIIAATTSPAILDSVSPEQIIDLSKPAEKAA